MRDPDVAPNDVADEPGAHILHTLFGIPGSDGFEINQRGVGDRLDPDSGSPDEALTRIPLDASAADGGIDERPLRDLLFRFPETLPIAAIDAASMVTAMAS